MDHDRLFKELLTTFFVEFLELFLPEVASYLDRESLEFLDKEIFTDVTAGERYEADLVVKAKLKGQQSFFLVHVEHQSVAQSEFSKRMFRYFSRLYEKYDLPVYPIVLFSYDAPYRAEPESHQVAFAHKVILNFHYDVIQLNRLNWRDFVQQQNPIASALMAKMKIAPQARRQVKWECLRLLATLRLDAARMKLISGFIDTYLQLSREEEALLQAEISTMEPAQQEVAMEIVTSWMRQGIEQGIQQGKQEGKQEGELTIILRLLHRRIGIEPQLQERVRCLSTSQLEDLAEALLDFSSQADLVAWLDNRREN